MSNLGYSFIPVHPGEIIKEELQSRGISQKRFAEVDVYKRQLYGGCNSFKSSATPSATL